ncbi:MAG TPA: sigma-70 family RNA polymerase sigma factor [Planctomycetota bacterium]
MHEHTETHMAALRRLARGLLYDAHGAEDVVQEAWLAALRKRPDSAPLGAWLRTAVRHLALDTRRRDERRARREADGARDERVPGPDEVLGQVELLHALLDAVAALEEPYRTTIGLRFLEGLPPRAIAARLGLPVNTVRTHVRRGLEGLRRRLDGQGRERFLAVLAPLAGPLPLGRIVAPSTVLLATSAAAVVGAVTLAIRGFPGSDEGARDALVDRQAPGDGHVADLAPAGGRLSAAVAGGAREGLAGLLVVRGYVTRGRAGPLNSAPVLVRLFAGLAPGGELLVEAELTSDASGAFAWEFAPPEATVRLELEAHPGEHLPARAIEYLPRGLAPRGMHVLECLPLDAELHGTVRDPAGAPVPGARLTLGPELATSSDATGRYSLAVASQEPEPVLYVAGPSPLVARLDLAPFRGGEARALDVEVAPGTLVRGVVRDELGAGLAGARVASPWHAFRSAPFGTAHSDAQGAYELLLEAGDGWVQLAATRAGHTSVERDGRLLGDERDSWGPHLDPQSLDFVLPAARTVSGRVVDSAGEPLEGAWVSARGPFHETPALASTDADGRFTLAGLLTGETTLRAGYPGLTQASVELASAASGPSGIVLALEPGAPLAGRVLDDKGRPVPLARVWASSASTYSDADGRFELAELPASARSLWVVARGFAYLQQELGPERTDLELRLAPSARLAGRVLDAASGAPIPRFTLRFLEPDDLKNRARWVPWTEPLVVADPTGEFWLEASFSPDLVTAIEARAEGYAPALVARVASSLDPDPGACELRLVRATRVSGVVVDAATGAPLQGARVWSSTRIMPTREHPHARTDPAGRFELRDLPTGPTTLHVELISHAPATDGPFLLAGASERRIELGHGASVVGRLLDPEDTPLAGEDVTLSRTDAQGQSFRWTTRTDGEGRFAVRNLLPGEYRLAWKRAEPLESPPTSGAWAAALGGLGYVQALPSASNVVSLDLVDSIVLTADQTLEVVLQARGGATLSGTLHAPALLPGRIPVALVRLDEEGRPTPRSRGTFAADGAFRFEHLEAGRYELRATDMASEPGLSGSAPIDVPEAGEVVVRLELVPGG